jgi:ribosomal protein L12E/L44/L45/RPP1/RPP2
MTKQYTQQELFRLQREANRSIELLNETKVRLAKEIVEALVKAHNDGKDLEGVTFDLVFAAKSAPVAKAAPAKVEEVQDDEPAKTTSKTAKGKK